MEAKNNQLSALRDTYTTTIISIAQRELLPLSDNDYCIFLDDAVYLNGADTYYDDENVDTIVLDENGQPLFVKENVGQAPCENLSTDALAQIADALTRGKYKVVAQYAKKFEKGPLFICNFRRKFV